MKQIVKTLLLAIAVVLPFVASAQDDACTLTLNWGSTSSSGWSGNDLGANQPSALQFVQDGVVIQTVSPTTGTSGTVSIQVNRWIELNVLWQSGDYDNDCSFTLFSAAGTTIYQCPVATFANGDTVLTLLEPCEECYAPVSLHTDSLGSNAVRLAWQGANDEYLIEVGYAGFTPGNGNQYTTQQNSLLIVDLDDGMVYEAYVYGYCNGEQTAPAHLYFTTPGEPVNEFPYINSFEPYEDHGWSFVQGSINQWFIGQSAAHESDYGLYISSDGGQTNSYINTQSLSYAYRTLDLTDTGDYTITFDYRVGGTDGQAYLRVFLVPASVEFAADVIPGTATGIFLFRNNTPAGWIDLKGSSSRGFFNQTTWSTHSQSVSINQTTAGQYNLLFLWCNDNVQAVPPAIAIDNINISHITCPSPTNFAATSVEQTEVLLSWTAGNEEDTWQLSVNGDSYYEIYDNPYLLDELRPGTNYTLRLRAVCADDDYSLPVELTVQTPCPEALSSYPYIEDFEAYAPHSSDSPNEMNPCWTVGYSSTSFDYPWVKVDAATGNHYLLFYGTGATGGQFSYAILPAVEGDLAEMELSLDLRRESANHTDTLIVGLQRLQQPNSISDGVDTVAILEATSGNFVRHRVHFNTDPDNTPGTMRRIVLIAPPSYFNQSQYNQDLNPDAFPPNQPHVDNVRLYPTPTCDEPENLRMVAATAESITLMWDAPYEDILYSVAYRPVGSDDWQSESVFENQFTLEELDAATEYQIEVRTVCDNDDISYAIAGTFRTLCAAIDEFPYIETFTTTDWADCWTLIDADQGGDNWSRSADGALHSEYTYLGSTDNWAITPAIVVPTEAEGFTLSVQAWSQFYGQRSHIQILLSDSDTDPTSFTTTLIDTTIPQQPASKINIDLASYAGQTLYIAFRHLSEGTDNLRIDNLRLHYMVNPVPVLNGPSTAAVDVETTFIATLSEGSEEGLFYQWNSTMEEHGHAMYETYGDLGDTLRITYDTIGIDTLTLVAINDYGYSGIVSYIHVIAQQPTQPPYSTGFESGDDVSWSMLNGTNGWYIGNAVAAEGNNALYISRDGGQSNTYDTATTSVSYAVRLMQITESGEHYAVSFDWRCPGETDIENGIDYMRLFLIPDSIDLVIDQIPNGADYTSDFSYAVPDGWIDLAGGPLADSLNWQHLYNSVLIPQAGTYKLAFVWLNDNEDGTGIAAAVDNFSMRRISCLAPTNLSLASATTTSLTVQWTAAGSEQQWEASLGNDIQIVSTPSATFSNLQPNTYYTVGVRAICSSTDSSTTTRGRFSTETDCSSAITLPYTEDFSGWQLDPDENYLNPCWNRFYVYDGGYSAAELCSNHNYLFSSDYYTPTGSLLMYSAMAGNIYFSLQFRSVAVLPTVQLPAGTTGVNLDLDTRFFAFKYNSQTDDTIEIDFLEVGYLTNANNPNTFVPVDTLHNHYGDGFQTQHASLPNYTPSAGPLALRYHFFGTMDFNYVAIDRLTLTPYDPTTSITDAEAIAPSIYPNPAHDKLMVDNLTDDIVQMNIISMAGVRTPVARTTAIDISHLPQGMYILEIVTNHQRYHQKFIKQ